MNEIEDIIKHNPMSRYQIVAVTICTILYMLDGFDVLVMAFTAAPVAKEWKLQASQVGMLLSAGLFGMTAGSLLLAPLADKLGRRALILLCLLIISVGMLLSAATQNMTQLVLLRLFTGLGIGGMLATLIVLASEYSSNSSKNFILSLLGIGYPIGAVVGGAIAALLMLHYDWRSVFLFGAAVSFIMIPAVIRCLPESLDFLLSRRPANALEQVNVVLDRMGHSPLEALPPLPDSTHQPKASVSALFAPELRNTTLLIWLAYFSLMFSFYFVLSWTPKLLVAAGMSASEGISGGVLINVGGIIGGILFGYMSSRFPLKKTIIAYLFLAAAMMAAFGVLWSQMSLALMLGVVLGIFLLGSMIGLYILTPSLYNATVRTTGMGWAVGIGRLGAIFSPFIAGIFLDQQWQGNSLFIAFSIPLLCSMMAIYLLKDKKARNTATSVDAATCAD